VADASDLQDEALWHGGRYELALELGDRDESRLQAALQAVWGAAEVEGCLGPTDGRPPGYHDVPCTVEHVERHGWLAGVARLPRGRSVVVAARVIRQRSGTDWLVFFVPVVALELAEPRSAAFGFRGADSLLWRRPLDRWLARLGQSVHRVAPCRLGLIGPDVAALTTARKLAGAPPAERWAGFLLPQGAELVYLAADR